MKQWEKEFEEWWDAIHTVDVRYVDAKDVARAAYYAGASAWWGVQDHYSPDMEQDEYAQLVKESVEAKRRRGW